MSRHIRVDQTDAVGVLTIDRRERQNRFDVGTARNFRDASLSLAREESVRVVVVRGAAGAFCGGIDCEGATARDASHVQAILAPLHEAIVAIRRAPKPFVGAVDGLAAATGLAIAMACDLVVCSERASFDWADPDIGLTGAESSTFFLPRLVGLKTAMELVLLSPRLDAREAVAHGLVNAVHPAARFGSEVMSLAGRLAAGPPRAYARAKALVNRASGADALEGHLAEERASLDAVLVGSGSPPRFVSPKGS